MLRLTDGVLPPALEPIAAREEGSSERVTLRVDSYEQVEPILAQLRQSGCTIEEMELLHTDLEDVFVRIMREAR